MGVVALQVYTGGGYDPNSAIFASMTGSPDAPGSGMAINPATGKLEQVYALYGMADPLTAGPMIETRRFFASDFDRPGSAQSLAGYAPGYYDHSATDLLEVGVLGGLAVIGGVAAYSVATGAAGASAVGGSTSESIYGTQAVGTGTVTGAGETSASVVVDTTAEGIVADAPSIGEEVITVTGSDGVVTAQVYDAAGAAVTSAGGTVAAESGLIAGMSSALVSSATKAASSIVTHIAGSVLGSNRTSPKQTPYLPQENMSDGLLSSIYGGSNDEEKKTASMNPNTILFLALAGVIALVFAVLLRR